MLNLLSNAFKVTVSGGIRVSLRGEGAMLLLSVADTGPGIPPEEQGRIFERFHRIRGMQARSYEGTGIGLSLVQEIVQLHGGRISVHSVVGDGAEFVVEVPLGREHLPPEHVSDEPADAMPRASPTCSSRRHSAGCRTPRTRRSGSRARTARETSGARVLVADDNPDLRRYLTRLLSPFWSVRDRRATVSRPWR